MLFARIRAQADTRSWDGAFGQLSGCEGGLWRAVLAVAGSFAAGFAGLRFCHRLEVEGVGAARVWEDFAGVHNAVGVDGVLNAAHERDCVWTEVEFHELLF